MSLISNAAILVGTDVLQTVLFKQGRSIAGIVPNLVVEETHNDEITITKHPVEQGASITDHAFKEPAQVNVRYGWSDSSGLFDIGSPSPATVYQQLLDLQSSRKPFDVVTGKRAYRNMLIKALGTTTDATTENCLMVTATLQEIIIVQTKTTTIAPLENHAMPEKTAPTVNTGTKQPVQQSESVLSSIAGFLGK